MTRLFPQRGQLLLLDAEKYLVKKLLAIGFRCFQVRTADIGIGIINIRAINGAKFDEMFVATVSRVCVSIRQTNGVWRTTFFQNFNR
jgi:hypothetical protein